MVNVTNHDMVGQIGKLGHVKSYCLCHDESIRSGKVMASCTNHDMVSHIGQYGSCQITLIMTLWVCQVWSGNGKSYQS